MQHQLDRQNCSRLKRNSQASLIGKDRNLNLGCKEILESQFESESKLPECISWSGKYYLKQPNGKKRRVFIFANDQNFNLNYHFLSQYLPKVDEYSSVSPTAVLIGHSYIEEMIVRLEDKVSNIILIDKDPIVTYFWQTVFRCIDEAGSYDVFKDKLKSEEYNKLISKSSGNINQKYQYYEYPKTDKDQTISIINELLHRIDIKKFDPLKRICKKIDIIVCCLDLQDFEEMQSFGNILKENNREIVLINYTNAVDTFWDRDQTIKKYSESAWPLCEQRVILSSNCLCQTNFPEIIGIKSNDFIPQSPTIQYPANNEQRIFSPRSNIQEKKKKSMQSKSTTSPLFLGSTRKKIRQYLNKNIDRKDMIILFGCTLLGGLFGGLVPSFQAGWNDKLSIRVSGKGALIGGGIGLLIGIFLVLIYNSLKNKSEKTVVQSQHPAQAVVDLLEPRRVVSA